MPEPVLQITPEKLKSMLKSAYELGCGGWMELSEEVAQKITNDYVDGLSESKPDKSAGDFISRLIGDMLKDEPYPQ